MIKDVEKSLKPLGQVSTQCSPEPQFNDAAFTGFKTFKNDRAVSPTTLRIDFAGLTLLLRDSFFTFTKSSYSI
jgi:hypothetical protein